MPSDNNSKQYHRAQRANAKWQLEQYNNRTRSYLPHEKKLFNPMQAVQGTPLPAETVNVDSLYAVGISLINAGSPSVKQLGFICFWLAMASLIGPCHGQVFVEPTIRKMNQEESQMIVGKPQILSSSGIPQEIAANFDLQLLPQQEQTRYTEELLSLLKTVSEADVSLDQSLQLLSEERNLDKHLKQMNLLSIVIDKNLKLLTNACEQFPRQHEFYTALAKNYKIKIDIVKTSKEQANACRMAIEAADKSLQLQSAETNTETIMIKSYCLHHLGQDDVAYQILQTQKKYLTERRKVIPENLEREIAIEEYFLDVDNSCSHVEVHPQVLDDSISIKDVFKKHSMPILGYFSNLEETEKQISTALQFFRNNDYDNALQEINTILMNTPKDNIALNLRFRELYLLKLHILESKITHSQEIKASLVFEAIRTAKMAKLLEISEEIQLGISQFCTTLDQIQLQLLNTLHAAIDLHAYDGHPIYIPIPSNKDKQAITSTVGELRQYFRSIVPKLEQQAKEAVGQPKKFVNDELGKSESRSPHVGLYTLLAVGGAAAGVTLFKLIKLRHNVSVSRGKQSGRHERCRTKPKHENKEYDYSKRSKNTQFIPTPPQQPQPPKQNPQPESQPQQPQSQHILTSETEMPIVVSVAKIANQDIKKFNSECQEFDTFFKEIDLLREATEQLNKALLRSKYVLRKNENDIVKLIQSSMEEAQIISVQFPQQRPDYTTTKDELEGLQQKLDISLSTLNGICTALLDLQANLDNWTAKKNKAYGKSSISCTRLDANQFSLTNLINFINVIKARIADKSTSQTNVGNDSNVTPEEFEVAATSKVIIIPGQLPKKSEPRQVKFPKSEQRVPFAYLLDMCDCANTLGERITHLQNVGNSLHSPTKINLNNNSMFLRFYIQHIVELARLSFANAWDRLKLDLPPENQQLYEDAYNQINRLRNAVTHCIPTYEYTDLLIFAKNIMEVDIFKVLQNKCCNILNFNELCQKLKKLGNRAVNTTIENYTCAAILNSANEKTTVEMLKSSLLQVCKNIHKLIADMQNDAQYNAQFVSQHIDSTIRDNFIFALNAIGEIYHEAYIIGGKSTPNAKNDKSEEIIASKYSVAERNAMKAWYEQLAKINPGFFQLCRHIRNGSEHANLAEAQKQVFYSLIDDILANLPPDDRKILESYYPKNITGERPTADVLARIIDALEQSLQQPYKLNIDAAPFVPRSGSVTMMKHSLLYHTVSSRSESESSPMPPLSSSSTINYQTSLSTS